MTATDLTNALTRYQEARPALKSAMRESALAIANDLADEHQTLKERLDKRWDWCWVNESHPSFIEREDSLLTDLATYEQEETALMNAIVVLFGDAA